MMLRSTWRGGLLGVEGSWAVPLLACQALPAGIGAATASRFVERWVVAVSARSGKIRWSTVLDTHGFTTLYSSPVASRHRLIVGVASADNTLSPGPYD